MAPQKEPPQGSDPRLRQIPVRYLVPNIVTLLALCSGITAIRLGMDGRFELAVACVILAALLDALDGRIARALKGSSKFGAELDSLADFVNFGVVPGLLIYMWSLNALKSLGWIVALALALCCALRLARFQCLDRRPRPTGVEDQLFHRRQCARRGHARHAAHVPRLP
jgi:CDP-diacylglycerol--serine O-phosphatidyltransferase